MQHLLYGGPCASQPVSPGYLWFLSVATAEEQEVPFWEH